MVSFLAIERCYLSPMTMPESGPTDSAEAAEPKPRATGRRRRLVLGVAIVAVIAIGTVSVVAVQHRQNIATKGLAGLLIEGDQTPYFTGAATQTVPITQIVVQQQSPAPARTVRVAWPVSAADLLTVPDFTVYAMKQETYDAQMGKTPEEVYGADTWSKLSTTQRAAFALERGWTDALYATTEVTGRNTQSGTPQNGLAAYDFTQITEPGNYRFRVCAEWIIIRLAADVAPGACSPALVYTMDRLEGS